MVKDILEIVGTEVSLLATGNFLDDRILQLKKSAYKKQDFEEDLSKVEKLKIRSQRLANIGDWVVGGEHDEAEQILTEKEI